jgi:hypothetical protein
VAAATAGGHGTFLMCVALCKCAKRTLTGECTPPFSTKLKREEEDKNNEKQKKEHEPGAVSTRNSQPTSCIGSPGVILHTPATAHRGKAGAQFVFSFHVFFFVFTWVSVTVSQQHGSTTTKRTRVPSSC